MNVLFDATDFLHGPPHLRFCGWPSDWIVSLHMSPPGGAGSQCYEAGHRQEGVEAEQGHGSLSLDECLNCESMFL